MNINIAASGNTSFDPKYAGAHGFEASACMDQISEVFTETRLLLVKAR